MGGPGGAGVATARSTDAADADGHCWLRNARKGGRGDAITSRVNYGLMSHLQNLGSEVTLEPAA